MREEDVVGARRSGRGVGAASSFPVFSTMVVSLALLSASCQKSLSGGHCECAPGWTCCRTLNVCQEKGELCPAPDPDGGIAADAPIDLPSNVAEAGADGATDARGDGPSRPEVAPPSIPLVCTPSQWCWIHPRPTGEALVALSVQGPNDVWVGGEAGDIFRLQTQGGGDTWSSFTYPVGDLAAMWGASSEDMWFGGVDGIYHWKRPGMFEPIPPSAPYAQRYVKAIWGSSARDVWVGGDSLKHFVDGLETPFVRNDSLKGAIAVLWGTAADDVFAGVAGFTSEGILHWGGQGWDQVDGLGARKLGGRGRQDVWASSTDAVEHYGKNGWTSPDGGPSPPQAWASTEAAVGALSEDGTLSWWEGMNPEWHPVPNAKAPARLTVLSALSKTDLWGAGPGGVLAHWDGDAWTTKLPGPALTAAPITQLAGAGLSDLWAVAGTKLLRGQGDAWVVEADAERFGGQINGIWSGGINDLWVLGGDDLLHHWNGTWSDQQIASAGANTTHMTAIAGTSANDLWILRGNVVHHYDGQGWRSIMPSGQPITRLLSVAKNEVWFGGQGLVHWNKGTATGARLNDVGTVTALAGSGPDDVWAAFGQNVYRYRPTEDTWIRTNGFDYPVIALASVGPKEAWALLETGSGRSQLWHITAGDPPDEVKGASVYELAPARLGTLFAAPDGSLWSAGDGGALLRHR